MLLPDSCSDPACDVFTPLEQAYLRSNRGTQVVWVDFWGTAGGAKKIAHLNHLTFPIVVDRGGSSFKAWDVKGFPYWLFFDARGRVLEARF